jgi:hypothetical protein
MSFTPNVLGFKRNKIGLSEDLLLCIYKKRNLKFLEILQNFHLKIFLSLRRSPVQIILKEFTLPRIK